MLSASISAPSGRYRRQKIGTMLVNNIVLTLLTIQHVYDIAEAIRLSPNETQIGENIPEIVITDTECIENRMEALEVGRLCSRRCKRDVPCENTRKQCLCDGLCGLSCIKPDLSCPDLAKIENGDYSPKTNRFNTKVVYQCEPGFYLFGSQERLCQGDEDWSGTPAECMPTPQCRNPIKVNHAKNPSDGTYRIDDKVNYSCYPGYQSRGSSESSCKLVERNRTAWVWSGSSPFRCVPKSCGDPGQIENGKRHGDSFIIASSVLYTCNEGFEMVGQARRYCQSDNQWSGQAPKCEPVSCNPTDHLENGKINYAYPLVFNSTVEYACDYGFRLIGPQRRVCGPERKLVGDVPVCEEINCGELGPLYNGHVKGYSTRMGDKKELTCMEDMKFVGQDRESVCLESGQWSGSLPQCLAPCLVRKVAHASGVYVIHPDELVNSTGSGNLTLKEAVIDSLAPHGSYLEVLCEKNYELDEQIDEANIIQAPICNNSTWSYEPRCKPASCRSTPPNPKNGRVRTVSNEHGSRGFIHCLDGFRLKGDNVTHCINGNWSAIEASCEEIYCGFPGLIEHGRVLLVGLTGMYDYKPYIRRISNNRQIAYECEVGYRTNDGAPSGATCMDGQWKPDGLPTCTKE